MEEPPTVMFDPVGELKKALDGVVSDEDPEGCVFIDRDGARFRHVLNWLRSGTIPAFDSVWRYQEV